MIELPQYSNSTKRQALLSLCPGWLTYANVRHEARSGNIDKAVAMYVDLCMYGHASEFAKAPEPSVSLPALRKPSASIYWANRRYPTPEIIQRLIRTHLIK